MKTLRLLGGLVLATQFASMAAFAQLPKNYGSWTAEQKVDFLWNKKLVPSAWNQLPPIGGTGWEGLWKSAQAAFSLSESFDHDSDEMPRDRPKIFHPSGSVAQFEFIADENTPYAGVLAGSVGLVRFSLGADPKTFGGYLPGMALKFMLDGRPSVNVHLLNSIEGQGDDHNLFARPLSNELPEPNSLAFRFILKSLKSLLGLDPLHVSLDHLSPPLAPHRLIFVPASGVSTSSNSEHDFREDLTQIPAGICLYEVYAQATEADAFKHMGRMMLKTPFVASQYGDEQLFFRHRR